MDSVTEPGILKDGILVPMAGGGECPITRNHERGRHLSRNGAEANGQGA